MKKNSKPNGFTLKQATDMLHLIDPDSERAIWVKALMALKSEYGDRAKEIAREWSMQSEKYKAASFNSDSRLPASNDCVSSSKFVSL